MYGHILVPLDRSALAECALPHARALARAFGAKLTLLHVLECNTVNLNSVPTDPLTWELRKAEAKAYLTAKQKGLQEPGLEVATELLEGDPAKNIVRFVRTNQVDLVALSSHGDGGLTVWNLGSVVQKVAAGAHVGLLVVRAFNGQANEALRYGRLLLPLDGSLRAECALPIAKHLARCFGTELLLTHVIEQPELPRRVPLTPEETRLSEHLVEVNRLEAERYLESVKTRLWTEGVEAHARLEVSVQVEDALHDVIGELQADLVVMAAHGFTGGTKRPFGRTALSVLAYGSAPLLIVQDLKAHEVEPSEAGKAAQEHQGH